MNVNVSVYNHPLLQGEAFDEEYPAVPQRNDEIEAYIAQL
jgi:hypothetical protein